MASFIRENGITSPAHRGEFYAYRNAFGSLEGVALIGHLILVETNSDAAMKAFAKLAQACLDAQTVLGEWTKVGKFLDSYSRGGPTPPFVKSPTVDGAQSTDFSTGTDSRPARGHHR